MAKIFISYSQRDKELVYQFVERLRGHKHEILMDETVLEYGKDLQSALSNAQREADGTICFITESSISSSNVNSEIGVASNYLNDPKNPKFLIPVVFGDLSLPYLISNLLVLQGRDLPVDKVIEKIEEAINDFLNQRKPRTRRSQSTNKVTSPRQKNQEESLMSILSEGVSGKNVTELQEKLKELGFFNSFADGIFGKATTEAVQNFQERNELQPTGEWDDESENKYQELLLASANNPDDPYVNPSQSAATGTSYWFLKIYGDDWGMENINEHDEGFFNSHFNSKEPRPDYENFKAIRIGDKGVAYDYSTLKSALFLFEVIQPLHKDPNRDEIFKFKVVQFLQPYIPYGSFSGYLSFSPDTGETEHQSLFRMSQTEYDAIITTTAPPPPPPPPPPQYNKATLSEVFSDSASKDIIDQLGFEADVDALAAVIAYEEVKPPLAVGLFGHWGSGKSFFMNKLQKRIDELAGDESGVFCKEVVQINFNSWHYSDSNLWASLITKIFDDLKKYGKGKETELENLFRNLNSTQELLLETKQKITKVETEINSLKGRQSAVEIEIKKNTQGLKSLSLDDITSAVMTDAVISKDIDDIKEKFDFLKLEEYKEIQSNISEMETGGKRVIKGLQILYSFKTWQSWFAVLIAAFIVFVVYYAIEHVGDLKQHIGKYKELVGAAAVLISQAVIFLRPWLKKIKNGYERLTSLKQTMDGIVEKKRNEVNATRENLKAKLESAQVVQTNLRAEIEGLESRKSQLKIEITDISSGKKIVRFIEGRVTDERYMNSLGIISWIRKDFEELDFLLKQQYDAEKMKELDRESVANMFKIDRIILYIDDLDRCDVAIVVRVLEAINLLLAFPLFVVIVGVDPRWMHSALEVRYSQMLKKDHAKTNDDKQTSLTEVGNPATSYDYLEKIFQIPFVLKPMDKTGKENLIKSQLQNKPPKKKEEEKKQEEKILNDQGEDINTKDEVITEEAGKQEEQNIDSGIEEKQAAEKLREEDEVKRIEEEKKKKEREIKKPELESLLIADEEISFMQGIGFLIGDSPRTIKRYINMYRIIRTHAMFEFTDDNYLEHYYAAMVLLAVVTGSPDEAPDFFEKIRLFDETETFNGFLKKHAASFKANAEKTGAIKAAIQKDKLLKPLGDICIEKFSKNIALISRFSFRHLEDQK